MKKEELSYKIKKLLEPCKYWGKEHKTAFLPVVEYASGLEVKVRKLEQELREIRQKMLLEPEVDRFNGRSSTLPDEEKVEYSLDKHCYTLVSSGHLESEASLRLMKYRRMTEEDVKTRALIYEKSLKID